VTDLVSQSKDFTALALAQVRIVLVHPNHPGNIGAAARALKNMGLSRLIIVGDTPSDHPEARAMSSGALDLLRRAERVDSLHAAIGDTQLQFAMTAREREIAQQPMTPRQAASETVAAVASALAQASASAGQAPLSVALVFGNETFGLSNEDILACNRLVHIPANPDYSSLNLAAAVQVMTYELRMAVLQHAGAAAELAQSLAVHAAPQHDVERFFEALEQSLVHSGFLRPDNPRRLMEKLRRLFHRAALQVEEVHILRGMLARWDEKAGQATHATQRQQSHTEGKSE
jgi:tRNA/rRNA methyltransferase